MGARLGAFTGGLNRNPFFQIRGSDDMKWFINSMLGYWILLLSISMGAAAVIYEFWLKGNM